jgi:CBS domain-containing protein
MVKYDIGAVVVLDKSSRVVGIMTERDVVNKIASEGANLKAPVSKFASRPVITAGPETKVWDAFTQMLRRKIRRLPVVEKGKLVGIVTERDLFKWVVRVIYEPNIPNDLRTLIAQSS